MWKISVILAVAAFAAADESAALKRRVCVIGTGPAGLTATKFLADHQDEFEAVTFEKNSDAGGMWIYTDSTTVDEHGLPVHSSAYKQLRVNVPKKLLEFPEYHDFQGEDVSYVRHDSVMQYLRNYTDHFGLRPYIRFNTNVEKVLPLPELKWRVIARDLETQHIYEVTCDAMMLANGHHVKGYVPKLNGIESFTGQQLHSHLYRSPKDFANKTVVVLGASYSGQEIAAQVSEYAKTVYLSHRDARLKIAFAPNVIQVLGVVGAEGNRLILSDGMRVEADVLIYATGFMYDFPFLDESSGIKVGANGKHIQTLYKHVINIERPTMAILNVPSPRLAFLEAHSQSAFFIAVLQGKLQLPSREEMLKDAELPAGTRPSKAHYVNAEIVDYYNMLAAAAGYETLPPYFGPASDLNTKMIFEDPLHFKENDFVLHDDGTFEFLQRRRHMEELP